jgi:hypothetical protein
MIIRKTPSSFLRPFRVQKGQKRVKVLKTSDTFYAQSLFFYVFRFPHHAALPFQCGQQINVSRPRRTSSFLFQSSPSPRNSGPIGLPPGLVSVVLPTQVVCRCCHSRSSWLPRCLSVLLVQVIRVVLLVQVPRPSHPHHPVTGGPIGRLPGLVLSVLPLSMVGGVPVVVSVVGRCGIVVWHWRRSWWCWCSSRILHIQNFLRKS